MILNGILITQCASIVVHSPLGMINGFQCQRTRSGSPVLDAAHVVLPVLLHSGVGDRFAEFAARGVVEDVDGSLRAGDGNMASSNPELAYAYLLISNISSVAIFTLPEELGQLVLIWQNRKRSPGFALFINFKAFF